LFTTLIAGISLFVGALGVANIMLVTVTERASEIGIRKAIGARRSSILKQFLIEATAISGAGGVAGVALGIPVTLETRPAPGTHGSRPHPLDFVRSSWLGDTPELIQRF
jgi:ABC-type antimicrobial peptide transport system permease subunit